MASLRRVVSVALLLLCTLAITGCNSLTGTYVLDHRELPDGSVQYPPEVLGCMTYTNLHRNTSVHWKDNGVDVSIVYAANYDLSRDGYAEKPIFYRRIDADGEVVELLGTWSAPSPVTKEGDRLSFRLPLYDEPELAFEGKQMTASEPGVFTDYWTKVE